MHVEANANNANANANAQMLANVHNAKNDELGESVDPRNRGKNIRPWKKKWLWRSGHITRPYCNSGIAQYGWHKI